MMQERSSSSTLAAGLAVVGGIAAAVGSILAWAKASAGPFSVSAKGIDGWEGKVTLVGGIIMLIAGVTAFVGARGAKARMRVSTLIGGLAAAGVGIYTAVTAEDQVIEGAAGEIAKQLGISLSEATASAEQAVDKGLLSISLSIGLYLVIAGGIIGILAGVLALTGKEMVPAMPGPAPSGAGLTGWSAPAPPPARPAGQPQASPWATPPPTPIGPAAEQPPVEGG